MIEYDVLAVKYGYMQSTRASGFYRYGVYGEPDGPLKLDYFFWVLRDGTSTILVDTGYDPDAAAKRKGRVCLIPPVDALQQLGIAPESVDRVIVTHFHFDHIGNVSSFPRARISLQRRELDFWLGAHGSRPAMAASVERSEVDYLRSAVERGAVDVLDGDCAVAPGIEARLVGGHCPGQQVVVVRNTDRPLVLASDALHFYEEMDRYMPYQVFSDLPAMYQTYETLNELSERDGALVVAGHDPEVAARFPALASHPELALHLTAGYR